MVNFIDNPKSTATINAFVKENVTTSELKLYDEYTVTFYMPTTETNTLSLKQHPDRYYNQDNTIYEYKWSTGKLIAIYKFNNGVIINPKNKINVKELTYP